MGSKANAAGPAPSGAASRPTVMPAMLLQSQGSGKKLNASVTRIARMVRGVFANEKDIADLEGLPRFDGQRMMKVGDKVRRVNPVEDLKKARVLRDDHLADLDHVLDYALTVAAYEEASCPDCQLPAAPLEFARAVAEFEPPATECATCAGAKTVRQRKSSKKAQEDFRVLSHLRKVLPDVVLCSKVRAAASDRNDAYIQLEAKNKNLLVKFGNERQTSLEGVDAEQGVRQGIIDAARRFDPFKMKNGRYTCASFGTVAYSWCFRNSRARQPGQKRAGVYAPSVEAMGRVEDGGVRGMIMKSDGAMSVVIGNPQSNTGSKATGGGRSVCHFCNDHSAIDPDTWETTGLCEACTSAGLELPKKKRGKSQPGDAPPGTPLACSDDLRLDLRSQVSFLPNEQQQVIQAELDGLNPAQISRKTGMTLMKVRRLKETAYARLRFGLSSYSETLRD